MAALHNVTQGSNAWFAARKGRLTGAGTTAPPPLTPTAPTKECKKRLLRDISALYKEPLPGVCVCVDDTNFTLMHALVTGPFGTPYESGFFLFELRYP